MPQKDKSGPEGQGPKTGRGMGNCSGSNESGTPGRPKSGRGEGRGRGCGRGMRNER